MPKKIYRSADDFLREFVPGYYNELKIKEIIGSDEVGIFRMQHEASRRLSAYLKENDIVISELPAGLQEIIYAKLDPECLGSILAEESLESIQGPAGNAR